MTNCPHDWVVEQMTSHGDMRAYYYIQCSKCGEQRHGEADEIPRARFKL